jgi:DNA polymerase III epsilon subunit-like protein
MIYASIDIEATGNNAMSAIPLQLGYALFDKLGNQILQSYYNIQHVIPPRVEAWSMDHLPDECLRNEGLRMDTAWGRMKADILRYSPGGNVTIIGHNFGSYDFNILRQYIPKEEWDEVFNYRICDTAPVGRFCHSIGIIERPGSCADYCNQFGVTNHHHHHAMWDAVAEGHLYFAMVRECRTRLGL